MSTLKQGRPKKNLKILLDLQVQPFSNVLNEIGGDPSKWSLRNEWIAFSKLYFNTSYPRSKHAKASRDFFAKNKDELLCSSSSVKNITPSCTPTLSEGTIGTQVDQNSVSADNSKSGIPIPRTVDVSTLTVDRFKSDSKSVNFPKLERIENCIFIVNN